MVYCVIAVISTLYLLREVYYAIKGRIHTYDIFDDFMLFGCLPMFVVSVAILYAVNRYFNIQ